MKLKYSAFLFSVIMGLSMVCITNAFAQPTDNPYLTRYPSASATHFTQVLKWSNIFNVNTFGAIANDNQPDDAAIEQAIAAANLAGGGVVYFPTGVYNFQRDVVLKSGVILRGDNPNVPNATDVTYRPPSRLEFPAYIFDTTLNGGAGMADSLAFKAITSEKEVKNIGVVNLDINRARIEFQPDYDSLGMESDDQGLKPNYQPRQANRNFIVFGVRSNNAAYPNPSFPDLSGPDKMRPWQRAVWYFCANIDLMLAENAVIANNRLNDESYDSFDQPNFRVRNRCTGCTNYRNVGQPSNTAWNEVNYVPVLDGSHARFNYTGHYGISLNRDKMVVINGRRTIKPFLWYPEPYQEPYLYAKGFEVLDNYVYKTERVGLWVAGSGMMVKGNVIRDSAINASTGWATPKKMWLAPNRTEVLRNASATYENRGIDFGGGNITIENNDVLVATYDFPENGYGSVDGEGIMDQGNGGGTNPNGVFIINNVVASNRDDCTNPTIGLYRTKDINNVVYEGNSFAGNSRCMQVEARSGFTMTNVRVFNNQNLKSLIVSGDAGGRNAWAFNNTGTATGGNMRLSCYVREFNNTLLTLQGSGCTPNLPNAVDTGQYPAVRMVNPEVATVLTRYIPQFELKALITNGNPDSVVFYLDFSKRLGRANIIGDTAFFTWIMDSIDASYKLGCYAYYTNPVGGRKVIAKSEAINLTIDDGDINTNNPLDVVLKIREQAISTGKLAAYPSPTTDFATLFNLPEEPFTLTITNTEGKQMQNAEARLIGETLDLRNLPAGMYHISAISHSTRRYTKIVKR